MAALELSVSHHRPHRIIDADRRIVNGASNRLYSRKAQYGWGWDWVSNLQHECQALLTYL